jgi:hypothetical protein
MAAQDTTPPPAERLDPQLPWEQIEPGSQKRIVTPQQKNEATPSQPIADSFVVDSHVAQPQLASEANVQPQKQHVIHGPADPSQSAINKAAGYAKRALEQVRSGLSASVESLNPLKIQPQVVTGARAVLRINGMAVGYANSISYVYETDWTEVSGIDNEFPDELAPGMVRVTGTINVFRRPNNSASQLFWQSDMLRMRVWPYSTIEVRDKKTDNLIAKFPRVAFTRRAETIAAGQVTMTQLSFISIGFMDELTPQPPAVASESSGLINQGKKIGSAAKNMVTKLLSFSP